MTTHTNGLKKYLLGVAIAFSVEIIAQTAFLIWWMSAINVRVQFVERDQDRLEVRVGRLEGRS